MMLWKVVWGSAIGRIVTIATLGFFAWQANNAYQRRVGANRAIAQINQKAEKQSVEALKARRNAERPGAAGRLLRSHCGDCGTVR